MVPGMRALIRPRFLVAAAVAGVAAGLIGVAMALLLGLFESMFYGVSHGGLLERLATAPPWRRALAPALGGLVAGGLWWWLRATGGVADVESAVADRSGQAAPRMGLARPFLDAVTQVLTVGAGNSVGREGAPRLAAGAVAARLATRLGIGRSEGAILIASAAGAGLAAMYNAPLGGAAYAVELVMVSGMRRRGALVAVPVCLIATLVSWLHSHGHPTFEIASPGLSSGTVLGLVLLAPVAAALGVQVEVCAPEHPYAPWHPGRTAEIRLPGRRRGKEVEPGRLVAHAGELHPRVVRALGLPERACAVEIDLDPLLEAARSAGALQVKAVSTFPAAKEDIALVEALVRQAAGDLAEEVRLFDVFRGPQLGEGKKSLAFSLVLRAPDRTLTAEETAAVRKRVVKRAAKLLGAELRS